MPLDSTSSETSVKPETEIAEEIEDITVEAFYKRISQQNDILLLDVRNENEFESWKIDSQFTPEAMHIPYTIFAEDGPYALLEVPQLTAVPQDRGIFVVCARGDASHQRPATNYIQPATNNQRPTTSDQRPHRRTVS